GEKVKELAEQEGFECFVDRDDEFDEWICYCTKSMMLDYKELNEVQSFLNELSRPYKGFADGWGTFGD
ncbi:MAG: ribonuclease E inhibitor RraB, partial [Bacillota bacterium]|nr:ribonuclease E inhibitor RraB [Bacillota bacterium]